MTEQFELRYVGGHVEVFDAGGRFCFSADTVSEAQSELRDLAARNGGGPGREQGKRERSREGDRSLFAERAETGLTERTIRFYYGWDTNPMALRRTKKHL